MKNIDLKWHRTKLVIIRNRFGIMYGSFLFLSTFTFVLVILLLGRISDVVNRIEDNQKAEACILQLARKERTAKNISGCVDKNNSHHKQPFKFNSSPNTSNFSTSSSSKIPVQMPTPSPVLHTVVVSKPPALKPVPTPSPPPVIKPVVKPVRNIIERVNTLGQQECQILGTTGWVLEVSGVCP